MGVQGSHLEGLIPRISHALFATLETASSAAIAPRKVSVRASYLEIYNEKLRDLLAPAPSGGSMARGGATGGSSATKLAVRENKTQGVFVHGLTTTTVRSSDEVLCGCLVASSAFQHIND